MKKRSKTPLSLIEITAMVLIFSICASICMRLFVSASEKANRSGDLANAVGWAQTAADTYKCCGGDHAAAAQRLGAQLSGETAALWLDKDWIPCAEADGAFRLTLTNGETAEVCVSESDGTDIYTLEVKAVPYG